MTAHSALKTALYSKLTASGTFNTAIGGRVYYLQAPQGAAMPCCVFSFYADNHSWDSGSEFEETYVQFSIFDSSSSSTTVGTLESNLVDLLANITLSVTGYTQVGFKRLSKRYLLDDNKIWNTIIEYRIELQKN